MINKKCLIKEKENKESRKKDKNNEWNKCPSISKLILCEINTPNVFLST